MLHSHVKQIYQATHHDSPDFLGFGIGLRPCHYEEILRSAPSIIDWFEIVTEDYLVDGGSHLYYLEAIRQSYPIVFHGVSLSIGSCDEINWTYLKTLKALADRFQPPWISDHLCWTGVNGINIHDLLPLPYTTECLKHVVVRVHQVQEFLKQPLVLENPSSYITYQQADYSEWEFLTALSEQTGCKILLDINNIFVSGFNHSFDPLTYLEGIPRDLVKQFHLAGHKRCSDYIIDTHDDAVTDVVWELYRVAVERFGKIPVLIERDDKIPPLSELVMELERAKTIFQTVIQKKSIKLEEELLSQPS